MRHYRFTLPPLIHSTHRHTGSGIASHTLPYAHIARILGPQSPLGPNLGWEFTATHQLHMYMDMYHSFWAGEAYSGLPAGLWRW